MIIKGFFCFLLSSENILPGYVAKLWCPRGHRGSFMCGYATNWEPSLLSHFFYGFLSLLFVQLYKKNLKVKCMVLNNLALFYLIPHPFYFLPFS